MKDYQEPDVAKSNVPVHGIIGAVRYAITQLPGIDMSSIVIDAQNGVPLLTGTVNSLREKEMVEEAARKAAGMHGVENRLVIAPTNQVDDRKLYGRVADKLAGLPSDAPSTVGVRAVDQGIAILSGNAMSAYEVKRAMDLAASVRGIKKVISEIEVAPGRLIDEIDVKNSVSDAISDNPRVNPFGIEICVDDYDVYLDGEVDDEETVQVAAELASQAPGVKHVINRLKPR